MPRETDIWFFNAVHKRRTIDLLRPRTLSISKAVMLGTKSGLRSTSNLRCEKSIEITNDVGLVERFWCWDELGRNVEKENPKYHETLSQSNWQRQQTYPQQKLSKSEIIWQSAINIMKMIFQTPHFSGRFGRCVFFVDPTKIRSTEASDSSSWPPAFFQSFRME